MEITALSNLVALSIKITGLNFEDTDAHMCQDSFNNAIEAIFNAIDLLTKWETRLDEHEVVDNFDSAEAESDDDDHEMQEAEEFMSLGGTRNETEDNDEVQDFHLG